MYVIIRDTDGNISARIGRKGGFWSFDADLLPAGYSWEWAA